MKETLKRLVQKTGVTVKSLNSYIWETMYVTFKEKGQRINENLYQYRLINLNVH